MAVCRKCGNQMAEQAAACPACGELRYQAPQPVAAPQYAAPAAAQPQYPRPAAQYPQQAYAAPQPAAQYGAPAPAYAMPVSADDATGFIGALFDFSFTHFITTKLIKLWYILTLIGGVIYGLVLLFGGLSALSSSYTRLAGLGAIIAAPIVFLVTAISGRLFCELVIVIFRAAGHLSEIAQQNKR